MLELTKIEHDFPSLKGRAYLNSAAEGIPPRMVGEALHQYWRDKQLGMDGREMHFGIERDGKESAARLLSLSPGEIGFCSCSAEAYNLLASALQLNEDDEVILNDLDFPSGFTPWLASLKHPRVQLWKARAGCLFIEDMAGLISRRTRLVQVSLVSFYNGFRLPWRSFINEVRRNAPDAVISVDLTQVLGRCVFDCHDADILISSTHKWILGMHGGCIVGVPSASADRLTTRVGGWYHIQNAFEGNCFQRIAVKPGAASYAVGMPGFPSIYALNAAMRYIDSIGVARIARHADPLTYKVWEAVTKQGLQPLAPYDPDCASGIVAFRHPQSEAIHARLHQQNIHVMHHAGRIRISVHGYNTSEDITLFEESLATALR